MMAGPPDFAPAAEALRMFLAAGLLKAGGPDAAARIIAEIAAGRLKVRLELQLPSFEFAAYAIAGREPETELFRIVHDGQGPSIH